MERPTIIDTHVHYWQPATPDRPHDPAAPTLGEPITAEAVLAQADAWGVGKIIQVTPSLMGYDNRYSLQAAAAHPDRIRVLGRLDPMGPELPARLREYAADSRYIGIRLNLMAQPANQWLRARALDAFWAEAERTDMALSVYAPGEAAELARMASLYPGVRLVVEHFAMPLHAREFGIQASGTSDEMWTAMLDLARFDNVCVKASALLEVTNEGPPYALARDCIRQAIDAFGSDRLMWGSNFPVCLRSCTYAETLGFVRETLADLPDGAADAIFRGTASRVFRLGW